MTSSATWAGRPAASPAPRTACTSPRAGTAIIWYESELSTFPEPLDPRYDPVLVAKMQAFTDELRARPRRPGEYGLIQRDMHSGNFLLDGDTVQLIDFDLGCYGWRMMDFAVLLYAHYFFPSLSVPDASPQRAGQVLRQLVEGYREEYPMPDELVAMVDDLIKVREILNYILLVPNLDLWQEATGNPDPPVSFSLDWIIAKWDGSAPPTQVDLSWL